MRAYRAYQTVLALTVVSLAGCGGGESVGNELIDPAEAKANDSKISAAQQRNLEAAIADITKAYGDGSIMRLGSAQALRQIEVIPTGALAIDLALGVGGVPRGRVVEIFGPESSGKTTLMLHVIANAQKAGGLAGNSRKKNDPGPTGAGGADFKKKMRLGRRISRAARGLAAPAAQWLSSSSTSKISVAFGGITPPAPRAP